VYDGNESKVLCLNKLVLHLYIGAIQKKIVVLIQKLL